jgi:DNA-directed RNA polymerase specialized sigma24 family protein
MEQAPRLALNEEEQEALRQLHIAATGDHGAFNWIATRYRKLMLRSANRVFHGPDAEDCVQDALLTLWRDCTVRPETILAIESPLGTLYQIAYNAARNMFVRRRARKRGGRDRHAHDCEVRRELYQLFASKHKGWDKEHVMPTPTDDVSFRRLGMIERLACEVPPQFATLLDQFCISPKTPCTKRSGSLKMP